MRHLTQTLLLFVIAVGMYSTAPLIVQGQMATSFDTPEQVVSSDSTSQLIARLQEQVQRLFAQLQALRQGVVDTSATGRPEEISRAASALFHQCTQLSNDLYLGKTDATTDGEVTKLQQLLGLYPTTGFFGTRTQSLVERWQKERGVIVSNSFKTGYGYVGPQTRESMACRETGTVQPSISGTQLTHLMCPEGQVLQGDVCVFDPATSFFVSQAPGTSTLSVAFSGRGISGLLIRFGDGSQEYLEGCSEDNCEQKIFSISHLYPHAGTYVVTLDKPSTCQWLAIQDSNCTRVSVKRLLSLSVSVSANNAPVSANVHVNSDTLYTTEASVPPPTASTNLNLNQSTAFATLDQSDSVILQNSTSAYTDYSSLVVSGTANVPKVYVLILNDQGKPINTPVQAVSVIGGRWQVSPFSYKPTSGGTMIQVRNAADDALLAIGSLPVTYLMSSSVDPRYIPPAGFRAQCQADGTVQFSWGAVPQSSGYQLTTYTVRKAPAPGPCAADEYIAYTSKGLVCRGPSGDKSVYGVSPTDTLSSNNQNYFLLSDYLHSDTGNTKIFGETTALSINSREGRGGSLAQGQMQQAVLYPIFPYGNGNTTMRGIPSKLYFMCGSEAGR